jgi:hypothetical protein
MMRNERENNVECVGEDFPPSSYVRPLSAADSKNSISAFEGFKHIFDACLSLSSPLPSCEARLEAKFVELFFQ